MITLSREYTIPHYDNDGIIMTMKHITVGVSVSQDPGETEEIVKEKLNKLYQEQIDYAHSQSPIVKKLKKQLNALIEEVKPLFNDQIKFNNLIHKIKNIG